MCGKRVWSSAAAIVPLVSQSTEKGHRYFSVKLIETNSSHNKKKSVWLARLNEMYLLSQ